jgi:hypothetical protein
MSSELKQRRQGMYREQRQQKKIDMLVQWNHKEPTKNDQVQCIETSSISVWLELSPFTTGRSSVFFYYILNVKISRIIIVIFTS